MKNVWLKSYFLINYIKPHLFNIFLELLKSLDKSSSIDEDLNLYNKFLLELDGDDLSQLLKRDLYFKNNSNIQDEIDILNEFINIDYNSIKEILFEKYPNDKDILLHLPKFINTKVKLLIADAKVYEKDRTFIFENNNIKPVKIFEPLKFSDLKGYEYNKNIILNNTKSLVEGKSVNNILLYGDAGCGKSTTVRALLNEIDDISIVQIFKNDLIKLDVLYEILRSKKDKFIIFADDISFDEDDETLSTMKAILEGALVQRPDNVVIYATSNRRHLVRESFQSRKGDEIHLNDTINEISSLSERFGINLLFAKPSFDEYIDIVLKLASDYNLQIPKDKIVNFAKKHSISKGSNSPRIARQVVDILKAGMEL